jgi:hypothetical protein
VFADSQIAALVPASWGGESDTWKLFSEVWIVKISSHGRAPNTSPFNIHIMFFS